MNAPRDPWDQGGAGRPPDSPGPRYYPPRGRQPGPGQPPPGEGSPPPGGPAPAGLGDQRYGNQGNQGYQGYGNPGYGNQGYGNQGYGNQPGYAYSPYGSPYPGAGAPPEEPPPARPGLMVLALILQLLATLPFLFVGLGVLLVPLNAASLPPELLNNPQVAKAGATPELLISLLRTVGVIMLVVALLYLLFAILAFAGRNWARIIVAVLSVGFVLLLAAGLVSGATVDTLAIVGAIIACLVGSLVILFMPASNAWFTRRR